MHTTAITARPFLCLFSEQASKVRDTFRPRIWHGAAIRTYLGGKPFVDFLVPGSCRNRLVFEHASEGRPARIENGFRHAGLGESGGIDIADRDVIELADDARRELMVKIVPAMGDLCVNRIDAALFFGSLCHGQRLFGTTIDALGFDLFAVGEGSEVFQAKVNADCAHWLTGTGRNGVNVDHDIQEPVTLSILGKVAAILDFAVRQGAAVKNAKSVTSETEGVTLTLEVTPFERHPAQRFAATAITQEGSHLLGSRLGVLLTDGIDGTGMEAEFTAGTASEFVEIEPCVPGPVKTQSILLPVVTEIPDKVNSAALFVKQAGQRFNTVSVNKNHESWIVDFKDGFRFFNRKASTAVRSAPFTPRPEGRGFSEQI